MSRRVGRLLLEGEELYMRRMLEDAKDVFNAVLILDEGNIKARQWLIKVNNLIAREENEQKKKALFEKYGYLMPKELFSPRWLEDPDLGHFEVVYSEYKRRETPLRKLREPASDEDIQNALSQFKKTDSAEDQFELAMLYWSRREIDMALENYLEAVRNNPEILAKDDELFLTTVSKNTRQMAKKDKASPQQLLDGARLSELEGEVDTAISFYVKTANISSEYKSVVNEELKSIVKAPSFEFVPPIIEGFRQGYIFSEEGDFVYIRLNLTTRQNAQIVPFDITIPQHGIKDLIIDSEDVTTVFVVSQDAASSRLWLALPAREEEFPTYNIRIKLKLDRSEISFVELSNYSLTPEHADNWSFLIGSQFDFSENILTPDFEHLNRGVRVYSYHLSSSEGRGPTVSIEEFTQPVDANTDFWRLIETGGAEFF